MAQGNIAPVDDWDRPSLLYPGRFLESNSDYTINGATTSYQPGSAAIRFIGPSTGWDGWADYPTMPTYWATFPYDNIAPSTGFMFGIRRQQGVWNSQLEIYP
jgi:hypothetical protein